MMTAKMSKRPHHYLMMMTNDSIAAAGGDDGDAAVGVGKVFDDDYMTKRKYVILD